MTKGTKLLKVVTIGGGNGNPISIESLILAGVPYIYAIVAGTDDGGITGRMRIDAHGTKAAFSDGLRSLFALFPPESRERKDVQALISLLKLRNARQQLGYDATSILAESFENPFSELKKILEEIINIKIQGEIIPTSQYPSEIIFKTELGKVYTGESNLDTQRMSTDKVVDLWLEPKIKASKQALDLIKSADLIIYSCGSLHGSIAVNLKHQGIPEAIKKSKAKKVYLTNLTSAKNETDNYTPEDFVKFFQKLTKEKHPLDYIIVPELTQEQFEKNPKNKSIVKTYASEGSHFLGWEDKILQKTEKEYGVKIIKHKATKIINNKDNIIRHDPKKLAIAFQEILQKLEK